MEEKMEKVLEKVKKLFELSRNNPSEEEAKSAATKAQELLKQYQLDIAEIDNIDLGQEEPIGEVAIDIDSRKWKYQLARIVANNTGVQHYYNGKQRLVFFGHKTDTLIAAETYLFLFEMGDKLGKKLAREAKKTRGYADNVYNSCVVGFCEGIKEAMAEQSKALMIVVPEDVKDEYKNISRNFRTFHTRSVQAYNGEAFRTGKSAGYNAMRRNALEG